MNYFTKVPNKAGGFGPQELCESRGGRPGHPGPDSPTGLGGRQERWKKKKEG